MNPAVGIDLGTTYSAVAWVNQDGDPEIIPNSLNEPLTASVVSLAGGVPIVGLSAKKDLAEGSAEVAHLFKRAMGNASYRLSLGGREWSPVELSAEVLRHLKAQAESALGVPVPEAVVTVPDYFTHPQRAATIEAGGLAGLKVLRIISEPTAAALAYGLRPGPAARRVLVYDLGGGTFDISLVDIDAEGITVRSTEGDHELGGRDWDERLAMIILDKYADKAAVIEEHPGQLLVMVEELKRALTARRSAEVRLVIGSWTLRCEVTREEFEAASRDLLLSTAQLTEKVLEETGLSWADIDGVLPVGGSTRMPMVGEWIERMSGRPPMGGVHPDQAVALGAAAQAAILLEQEAGLRLDGSGTSTAEPILRLSAPRRVVGTVAHSLGMIAENADGDRYVNSVLLPRNRTIPCVETRPYQFHVKGDGTDLLEVFLTQGETDDPAPCAYLGRYLVSGFPSRGGGKTVVDIAYAYDDNAMVEVTATDRSSGAGLRVDVSEVPKDVPQRFLEPPVRTVSREPVTIYLAFDLSGSMSGTPLNAAQKAARTFLSQLDLTTTAVGIVSFSDRVDISLAATHNAADVERAIKQLTVGSTGLGNDTDPFAELRQLLSGTPGKRFGVVLADGVWYNQATAERRARECHKDGVEIIAVGFGSADRLFLQKIASSTEQAMFTSVGELSSVFGTIAREITQSDTPDYRLSGTR